MPKKPAKIPEINPVKNKRREIMKKVSISNIV